MNEQWMVHAACRGHNTNDWFPDRGGPARGRQLCNICTVTIPCLDYALAHHITHGIWGGCSERERRRVRKQRRQAA